MSAFRARSRSRIAVKCLAMWPSLRACAASAAVIAAASASSGGWQPPPQGYGQQYDYNNQAPPQQYEQYDQAQQYGGYDQQQQYGGYYDQQQPAWGSEPTYGEAEVVEEVEVVAEPANATAVAEGDDVEADGAEAEDVAGETTTAYAYDDGQGNAAYVQETTYGFSEGGEAEAAAPEPEAAPEATEAPAAYGEAPQEPPRQLPSPFRR